MSSATRRHHAGPATGTSQAHAKGLMRTGWAIVLGAIVPLGLWVGFAPLSMAVVAPAVIKVELNRRPVQHLEGGIVHAVYVRDGQYVNTGEPILQLGSVDVDADYNRLGYRIHVEHAALARLEAEQRLSKTLVFPKALLDAAQSDPRVAQAITTETALFQARRDTFTSEVALLHTQREHIEHEIAALRAQVRKAQNSLALQTQDLDANRGLFTRGLISPTRLAQIEAVVAEYAAKLEERRSELARAEQRLGENALRVKSMQNHYVQVASDQLKVTAARLDELKQELRKLADAATRQVVTAPASGDVIGLKFTSPGAVVQPGEPIAEIVPRDAPLMVEAYVRPSEINHVRRTQRARIRFTAFKYRSTALVTGTVTYVSADRLLERVSNLPYYSAMIRADADSLHAAGDLKLQAGMPAEVYFEGTQQTTLQYLLEPITSTLRKAGREM
jgi:HlyD family secretion protein